ncbi:MAG: hemerythrin family protein [Motiliproteus sp.]|nr:hemerythrin family protein [Motiliproteus sp.]
MNKTGHTVIDMQHMRILDWFEKLESIPAEKRFGPYASAVLEDLQVYIQEHFELEEGVMDECEFPDLDRHRHLHSQLSGQVVSFVDQYHQTGVVDQDQLIKLLRDWLIRHINQEDAKLAEFLEQQIH